MTGPFSEGDTEIRWSGETEPEETGGEERSNTKLATMAEMTGASICRFMRLHVIVSQKPGGAPRAAHAEAKAGARPIKQL